MCRFRGTLGASPTSELDRATAKGFNYKTQPRGFTNGQTEVQCQEVSIRTRLQHPLLNIQRWEEPRKASWLSPQMHGLTFSRVARGREDYDCRFVVFGSSQLKLTAKEARFNFQFPVATSSYL